MSRRKQALEELDSQIREHIDREIQDNIDRGMAPEDARRAAHRRFGAMSLAKEDARAVWIRPWVDRLRQDVLYALRQMRREPGVTFVIIAVLALGIGATTAIFSVIDTVLLRPVPFPEPERVVFLINTTSYGSGIGASPARFNLWRQQTDVFEAVSAERSGVVNLTGVDVAEQLQRAEVSADFFHVYGIALSQGRSFTAEEDRPNGPHVAVISEGLWKRRFGGTPRAIGTNISLNGVSHEIIGVVSAGFKAETDSPAEVWTPFRLDPNNRDHAIYFTAAARLKPGVTLDQAKARLTLVADEFRRMYPAALGQKDGFSLEVARDTLVGNVGGMLWVLAGAVTFVLLIACANVANLLLVRATARRREIAVRLSIGASRGRIVRQLLTESVLLAALGGVCGVTIGIVGIKALLAVNPATIPRLGPQASYLVLNWRVLLFTTAVTLVTGVLFGTFPALQAWHADPGRALKDSAGRSGTGLHHRVGSILIVAEVTLALVLLVGAALLIRSFVALRFVEPGFDAHNVLTMRMSLTDPRFERTGAVAEMTGRALDRLNALPGVAVASAACCVPLEAQNGLPFVIAGRPLQGPMHGVVVWLTISPRYFDVFKVPLVRGRSISDADRGGSTPVVVINQTMARDFWKDTDPLGDRLIIGGSLGPAYEEPARQIIGIVGDVHDWGLNRPARPAMYVPSAQLTDSMNALFLRLNPVVWVVRTKVEPHTLRTEVQEQLRDASGGLPVGTVRSMDEIVGRSTAEADFSTILLTVFGSVALVLAAIGLYGLMAYTVQQRTQEIGIRLALGANPTDVRNMMVAQGMRLAASGVVAGLVSAFVLARVMRSLLFGISPRDPLVFVVVPLFLTVIALVCSWLPARLAARVNPLIALRSE